MNTYQLETGAGDQFSRVAENAKAIASKDNFKFDAVEFGFNGVKCIVTKDTNLDWLYRDYHNSWDMEWKTVGPDCVENYSEEIQQELNSRIQIREEKSAKREQEYRAKEAAEKAAFEKLVEGVSVELSKPEEYANWKEKNSDPYGRAAFEYAEAWAKKMQLEILKGKTVSECAEEAQEGLGFFGITGFQYGCAVGVLSETWKYGEELRKWHNKQYGVSEEKEGVVNPAVLTITA